jgi:hypothetical protein
MINTPSSRIKKLKWLLNDEKCEGFSNLQIQKYLFFAEMFNKHQGEEYSIRGLKAYQNGPVFSDTWGDMVHDSIEMDVAIASADIDFNSGTQKSVEKSKFLVKSLTNGELTDLTHSLDLWKSKEKKIRAGYKQIPINENDISDSDLNKIEYLYSLCDTENCYNFIEIADKRFLILEEDMPNLTNEHLEILEQLSDSKELINPVYISIEEGVLLVD